MLLHSSIEEWSSSTCAGLSSLRHYSVGGTCVLEFVVRYAIEDQRQNHKIKPLPLPHFLSVSVLFYFVRRLFFHN